MVSLSVISSPQVKLLMEYNALSETASVLLETVVINTHRYEYFSPTQVSTSILVAVKIEV